MRTLGLDLASQPAKTGLCTVEWGARSARVVPHAGLGTDDDILRLHASCDAIGIDIPFGWPESFLRAVAATGAPAPPPWSGERRDELCFRRTDFAVRALTGRWPLSVSADRIAIPALRCTGLLAAMGVSDRSGDDRVFEAYPAASLHQWGLPSRGYKGRKNRPRLSELVQLVFDRCPWLEVDPTTRTALETTDDLFDALICALVARAATLGLTIPPPPDDLRRARTEGWIHIPHQDALKRLAQHG